MFASSCVTLLCITIAYQYIKEFKEFRNSQNRT